MGMTTRRRERAMSFSWWPVPGLLAALVLGGCSTGASESDGAVAGLATVPDSAGESTPDAVLAAGDAGRGRLLYLQCRACHSLERGGVNTVGPNLHGMFGSAAGKVADFVYSDPLMESGIVWSPHTVDEWLASPSAFVPGNRMIFLGLSDPKDRADLIAYMQQATAREE